MIPQTHPIGMIHISLNLLGVKLNAILLVIKHGVNKVT
jgi:hypothetical protein